MIPSLRFSHWYRWAERAEVPGCRDAGVYLLSITPRNDLAGTPPDLRDVVYIGMSNNVGGLVQRWAAFDRTIRGGAGHSGGRTIREHHGLYPTWTNHLYVAAMGLPCQRKPPGAADYRTMGMVAYLEYEAFAAYHEQVGGHPRFNKR